MSSSNILRPPDLCGLDACFAVCYTVSRLNLQPKREGALMEREQEIRNWVQSLLRSFERPCRPVDPEPLMALHSQRRYVDMVGTIRNLLNLSIRIRVGLVNSGGPADAPAWIRSQAPLPPYGTQAFSQAITTVYIRREFLAVAPFCNVVMAMSHELSHVVLDSIRHPLRQQEEAVDLTAMLLGFREFYLHDEGFAMRDSNGEMGFFLGGYLSVEEAHYAAQFM